jgi:hypothetical protein
MVLKVIMNLRHNQNMEILTRNSFKIVRIYSKTSFLVQIKFITEDSEQTQTQILILN